jgi:hypothetical protein
MAARTLAALYEGAAGLKLLLLPAYSSPRSTRVRSSAGWLAGALAALGLLSGLPMLVWFLVSTAPARPRPTGSMSGEVCRKEPAERSLLLEVPFTASEMDALELSLGLWTRVWPCRQPQLPAGRPDLMFAFNGNLSDARHGALRARLAQLLSAPVLAACFGSVMVESAGLSQAEDVYDKKRLAANWTVGPNNLFDFAVATAASHGYRYMMQLELDVLPIRRLWLEKLVCLAAEEVAWVRGSPLLAPCARGTGQCTELGDAIKFHINGNALYAVGQPAFRRYLAASRAGSLRDWPFDLALHLHASRLSEAARRRLRPRFRHDTYIAHFGSEPLPTGSSIDRLRARWPSAYLLHSAWAVRLLRSDAGSAGLTGLVDGRAPGDAWPPAGRVRRVSPDGGGERRAGRVGGDRTGAADDAPTSRAADADAVGADAVADAATGAEDDSAQRSRASLLALARRRSDAHGRLILTFATSAYDAMCDNFLSHIRARYYT